MAGWGTTRCGGTGYTHRIIYLEAQAKTASQLMPHVH